MLAAHVGEATFLDGVGRYLRRHVYANTVSADLWDALAEAAGADVEALMRPWLTQVRRTRGGSARRQAERARRRGIRC
jgi:aminopeptidase 2